MMGNVTRIKQLTKLIYSNSSLTNAIEQLQKYRILEVIKSLCTEISGQGLKLLLV